jgi:AcrR family transcriptional regulator
VQIPSDRPLRADAERNRQRILEAAATVFAERGLDVSLDDIAAAAGVGVGTVYRRFPDKDSLIDALFEAKIRQVHDLATAQLAVEDPWEALAGFVRGVCELQAVDRALKQVLYSRDRGSERVAAARNVIAPVAMQILQRAQDAGVARADLGQYDLPLMHFAVGFVADTTRDVAPEYWERMLTIMLDGIRTDRAGVTPMPAPPLSRDEFVAAMGRPPRRGR